MHLILPYCRPAVPCRSSAARRALQQELLGAGQYAAVIENDCDDDYKVGLGYLYDSGAFTCPSKPGVVDGFLNCTEFPSQVVHSGEALELGSALNLLESIWITLSPVLPSSPEASVLYTYDEAAYMDKQLRPCTEGTPGCLHWFSVRGAPPLCCGLAGSGSRRHSWQQPQPQRQNDHSAALFCCPSVQAVVLDPSYPIMFVCTGEGGYVNPRGEDPMVIINECDQDLDVAVRYRPPELEEVIASFPMACDTSAGAYAAGSGICVEELGMLLPGMQVNATLPIDSHSRMNAWVRTRGPGVNAQPAFHQGTISFDALTNSPCYDSSSTCIEWYWVSCCHLPSCVAHGRRWRVPAKIPSTHLDSAALGHVSCKLI